ncbi:MAG: magnesium transporter [Candidatus Hermodarchaeia archaeon]|jgi:mgtE-like transporter
MTEHTVRKILMESLPVLAIVLVFALAAGQFLDHTLEGLKLIFPLILLMVPAFIDITGDLAGDEGFRPYRLLLANLIAIFLVSTTAYAFLGVCVIAITIGLTPVLGPIFPAIGFPQLFFAILAAGVLATVATSVIGLFAARLVYRSGRDPDSIIPPLTTTVGDLLGIVFIAMALLQVGLLFGIV